MATKFRRHHTGFTLIELMLAVAIVGLLSSLAMPKFAELTRRARESKTRGNLGAIRSALSIYYADNEGRYPNDPFVDLVSGGKYLSSIPNADVPPYHYGNRVSLSMNAGVFYEYSPDTLIVWHYRSPMFYSTPLDGFFCVACIHTDTLGKTWTTY